ncbi:MAG: methyltransferase domain-containing protein, partial [Chitinophagaceae bacterium]
LGVERGDIFLKLRQRKAGRLGQYQKLDAVKEEFMVQENGLNFLVNLSDYLDTGLFLDHRVTRQLLRGLSHGKRFLNLFAYTGSFSVYAAAGKAARVTTVDLSKTYLAWAERNMKANDFYDASKQAFVHADVVQYLKDLPDGSYDLIVLDPPTFSNSKRMETFLDIQSDYVELVNDCMRILAPGGMVFFSTNRRDFEMDASAINASEVKDITRTTTPFDFEGKLFRYCFRITK